ncbi:MULTISPECIES: carbamoyl-phosphate synthase [unclassified Prochlorococcus]|uniref:carbamoyl-phosphate synthase n=1 Tax=unclassified Prochlorococcus TaxID=2627481 RepID=UPI000533741C|nr:MULTISPECIES: carbamoyl-phosphate synthase [unclassified Prochlorococcus]KGG25825.1 putative Carbamoyl-phosphate synthase L chain [Prochlorococcus sp. MIT 0701]KGG26854.1 putative Carbamoyl-phosphate synthase L chain [Prochlorococcus sp. MIT 0702]KGG36129.1 putative Carbamoyl-phosphate synthase L chain [Prochlorococcus sp. MIT 0703]
MQRSLRLPLSVASAAALALASTPIQPVAAQEEDGSASDLGVMEINLKDAVQFNWGFQGALQGAGTPNQAGIGAFLPIAVGENSVWFIDALANANFADREGDSSIINTDVAGTTVSTSTRLGYRWLNGDRSWMFGVNAGYDSRPMNTGNADTGVDVTDKRDVFFQQVAAGLEAVSNTWNFNAYALVPVGDTEQRLNNFYLGGALDTYGLDVGYSITPDLNASVGYYYQQGDLDDADSSGVKGRLAYNISNGLTLSADLSYDEAFDTRCTADIKYRFGNNGYGSPSKKEPAVMSAIQALSATPANRDVRVHDGWCVEVTNYEGDTFHEIKHCMPWWCELVLVCTSNKCEAQCDGGMYTGGKYGSGWHHFNWANVD